MTASIGRSAKRVDRVISEPMAETRVCAYKRLILGTRVLAFHRWTDGGPFLNDALHATVASLSHRLTAWSSIR